VLAYLIAGGGPQTAASPPAQPLPRGAVVVTLRNYAFDPPVVVVRPGQAVVWVNKDEPTHTVTSDAGAWPSRTLLPGQTFSLSLTRPGTYHYTCLIHPYMHGTVIVGAAPSPPAGAHAAATATAEPANSGGYGSYGGSAATTATAVPAGTRSYGGDGGYGSYGSYGTAPTPAESTTAAAPAGSIAGVVTDAATGRPLPHVLILVDYTHGALATETDGQGLFVLDGVATGRYVDAFGFAPGYYYYHGFPLRLHPGIVARYSFQLAAQTGGGKTPRVEWVSIGAGAGGTAGRATTVRAGPGAAITITAHVTPGQAALSNEVMAASPALGRLILLHPLGHDLYRGSLTLPPGMAPGTYAFRVLAAGLDCVETPTYPMVTVVV
jgi:plastocyanin